MSLSLGLLFFQDFVRRLPVFVTDLLSCLWDAPPSALFSLLRFPIVLILLCSSSSRCSRVVSFATIQFSGWLQFANGGNNAFCPCRSSVAVSCTDPCKARPLGPGKLWLSFFWLTGFASLLVAPQVEVQENNLVFSCAFCSFLVFSPLVPDSSSCNFVILGFVPNTVSDWELSVR